jgi:folate-dependent phosphoribosylglycinamide formyltransferase PurN
MINGDFESTGIRIAVLASGSGTTLQAVIDACEKGLLDGRLSSLSATTAGRAQ